MASRTLRGDAGGVEADLGQLLLARGVGDQAVGHAQAASGAPSAGGGRRRTRRPRCRSRSAGSGLRSSAPGGRAAARGRASRRRPACRSGRRSLRPTMPSAASCFGGEHRVLRRARRRRSAWRRALRGACGCGRRCHCPRRVVAEGFVDHVLEVATPGRCRAGSGGRWRCRATGRSRRERFSSASSLGAISTMPGSGRRNAWSHEPVVDGAVVADEPGAVHAEDDRHAVEDDFLPDLVERPLHEGASRSRRTAAGRSWPCRRPWRSGGSRRCRCR